MSVIGDCGKTERLLGDLEAGVGACSGKGVRHMGSVGEAIERRAVVKGKAEGAIAYMNGHGCGIEEALTVIGYDRSEWPTITKVVKELLAQPIA